MYRKLFLFFLFLMSFNSFSAWESRNYEPMPMQMFWRSDIDAFESDFQVKLDARYLTEDKTEFTYDLQIFGTKQGKKYLAYEEKDIGYKIYSITTTAQGYSPLIIVSADDDKGDKIIRGYQYKEGKVTRGAIVRSLRFPEILLYSGESGVRLIFSKFDKNGKEMFYKMLFTNRRWLISDDDEFAAPKNMRYRGVIN